VSYRFGSGGGGRVPAETFASADALRPLKDFDAGIAEIERRRQMGWSGCTATTSCTGTTEYDIGSKNAPGTDPALDDSSVTIVQIPGGFKELGVADTPQLCWSQEFTLPDSLPQGMARLYLGPSKRWIRVHQCSSRGELLVETRVSISRGEP